jgi:hypothetical protein
VSWPITNGTAQLAAVVVLTRRVTLDIGGAVTTLKLAGGTTPSEAASVYTGGGRLVLHGVTITSADRTFRQAMPPASFRPFVVVSPGGRLEATDATVSDLGGTSPGDRSGTMMSGIHSEQNGGNGVRAGGAGTGRPITGISTAGNGRFGIAAITNRCWPSPRRAGGNVVADRLVVAVSKRLFLPPYQGSISSAVRGSRRSWLLSLWRRMDECR